MKSPSKSPQAPSGPQRQALRRIAEAFARQNHSRLLARADELLALWPEQAVGRRARAVALLHLGRPAEAAAAVAGAADPDARDAEAASLLGLALIRLGRLDEAQAALERAICIDRRYAAAWANLGALRAARGEKAGARRAFGRALQLQPALVSARLDYAQALADWGELEAARAQLEAGAALPGAGERLHLALAQVCGRLHDRPAELAAAQAAAALAPDSPDTLRILAALLFLDRRYPEALALFRRAWRRAPHDLRYPASVSEVLRKMRRPKAARAVLARALARAPDAPSLLVALASHHLDLRRLDAALAPAERATEIAPGDPQAHATRGAILYAMGRLDEAKGAYEQAVRLSPTDPSLWNALGLVHNAQGRALMAVRCFKEGLKHDPQHPVCLFSLGLAALALGDWDSGWPLYEWRWLGSSISLPIARPVIRDVAWWAGEPLRGESLIVLGEQGHGDNLQFVRLLPLLEGVSRVKLAMARPLIRLMERSLDDLPWPVELVERDTPAVGGADRFVTLLSLPARLGLTQESLPPFRPWLEPDPADVAQWRRRLADEPRLKVGLVWRGNPDLANDRWRSTDLAQWAPLLRRREVRWISLQKLDGPARRERALLARHGVADWTDELKDFADTAALVQALDLVIAVDTSVAHLAGGLGRPVWMLNRAGGEWRWGARRTSSIWYPTMRIFNQARMMDWGPVLARVSRALGQAARARAGELTAT